MSQSNNIFQLSAVSQNDNGCTFGKDYTLTVINVSGGTLRDGSFPVNEAVKLPIPPAPRTTPPLTPTWFLITESDDAETSFEVVIECSKNGTKLHETLHLKDVKKWAAANAIRKTNQIYQEGNCGIFGFATPHAPQGWIYTFTVGVTNPRIHP